MAGVEPRSARWLEPTDGIEKRQLTGDFDEATGLVARPKPIIYHRHHRQPPPKKAVAQRSVRSN